MRVFMTLTNTKFYPGSDGSARAAVEDRIETGRLSHVAL